MRHVIYPFASHSGRKFVVSIFCHLAAALFVPAMMADDDPPNIPYDSPQGEHENCGTIAIENILMKMYNAGLLPPPPPKIADLKKLVEQTCSNECVNATPPQPPPCPTNNLDDVIMARVLVKLRCPGATFVSATSYWDWLKKHQPGPKFCVCILVELDDGSTHWQTVDSCVFDDVATLTVSDPNSHWQDGTIDRKSTRLNSSH